jgi:hypothetical protein
MTFPGGGRIESCSLRTPNAEVHLVNYISPDGFMLGFQHMRTHAESVEFAASLATVLKELDRRDVVIPGIRA